MIKTVSNKDRAPMSFPGGLVLTPDPNDEFRWIPTKNDKPYNWTADITDKDGKSIW